jgi:non-specific serine/threonine protein kinase/serine/threonine-protein kinase
MGQVWLAEQTEPVRRKVAFKLIKAGMDTKEVVVRFEAERQALAMMDHPAIAKVFDGGSTPEGRPYFAMEYVPGRRITDHCDAQSLTPRERLELFIQVCEGVQHAHQKAVIHRDLKPSNILVVMHDGKAIPKIIDFGVAKAMAQPLTEKTLYTHVGAIVGTPEYMSPEQAGVTGLDVDTRTDVYSLGVILYELLVGTLPLESKELRQRGYDDLRRKILEDEPQKPSTRLRTLGDASSLLASKRRRQVPQLARELKGDLDWITMKALEKNRERRYHTPSELAADIRRHLDHEPVLACPPSVAYRAHKFIRRHRLGVSVATTAVVLLVLLFVTTTIQARRIARERDHANQEARVSQQVTEFLTGLFAVSDPGEARGKSITARELLDTGAEQIESRLRDQPEVQARLMGTIGNTYTNLGLYTQAQAQLERTLAIQRDTLGPEHVETLRSMCALARVYVLRNQFPQATKLYQQAVDSQLRVLGPEHPDRLAAMQDLGWLIARDGRHAEGEKLVSNALAAERRLLGNEHVNTLLGMNRYASVMGWEGRFADQERILREEVDIRTRVQGRDHPRTLAATRALAGALSEQGRFDQAERLYRDSLESTRKVLGPHHPQTTALMNSIGLVLQRQGRLPEAEDVLRDVLGIQRRELGPDAESTILTLNNLGVVYLNQRRYQEAEKTFIEALDRFRRVLGPEDRRTMMAMNNLGETYAFNGRFDDATTLLRETLALRRRIDGENHPSTAHALYVLSTVAARQGRHEEALKLFRDALDHGYQQAFTEWDTEYWKSLSGDARFEGLVAELRKVAPHEAAGPSR